MSKLNLLAPWVEHYRKIEALFGCDPDVEVAYNESEEAPVVNIYVTGHKKTEAISKLLPKTVNFGGVNLTVNVHENTDKLMTKADLIAAAFEGNPALDRISPVMIPGVDVTYILFKKEVVQYYTDTMQDPNGLKSTLYQDLAEDIIGSDPGVFFTTAKFARFGRAGSYNKPYPYKRNRDDGDDGEF